MLDTERLKQKELGTEDNMFKQTDAQKRQAKKLNKLINKIRNGIKLKRKEETKILAVMEGAREIVADPKFWTQGVWFNTRLQGRSDVLATEEEITNEEFYETWEDWNGEIRKSLDVSLSPDNYYDIVQLTEATNCDIESRICSVCAEGAIYLAADGIIDGWKVIGEVNRILDSVYWNDDIEVEGFISAPIQEVNDNQGHAPTVAAFDYVIQEYKRRHKLW